MKNNIIFLVLIVGTVMVAGCGGVKKPQYDTAALEAQGAQYDSGIVVIQRLGSITLKNENGEERQYYTGRETQYIPDDYRSQKGDEVHVHYRADPHRSGNDKNVALVLKSIKIGVNSGLLPNPIMGTVLEKGRGSFRIAYGLIFKPKGGEKIKIYVSRDDKIIVNGKKLNAEQVRYDKWVGKEVELDLYREPNVLANGYIYRLKGAWDCW